MQSIEADKCHIIIHIQSHWVAEHAYPKNTFTYTSLEARKLDFAAWEISLPIHAV